MFSYRHAFHAGNHADVLKHSILVAMLRYMTQKDTALSVVDTHAGAGLYRLDGDQARTSGEAASGIFSLVGERGLKATGMGSLIDDYLAVLREFNPPPKGAPGSEASKLRNYPGSPLITEKLLRPQDRAHVFEVHPTDQRLLRGLVAQRDSRRIMTLPGVGNVEANVLLTEEARPGPLG